MNIAALKALLADYADLSDADATAALNAKTVTVTRETLATERTLYGSLGPVMGEAILQALAAVAGADAVIARTLDWLSPAQGGIDLGHAATRAQIDALVQATVLTSEQGTALKAMAEHQISPAEQAGLGHVRVGDVTTARAT